jgi:hypothetical protein
MMLLAMAMLHGMLQPWCMRACCLAAAKTSMLLLRYPYFYCTIHLVLTY